MRTLLVVTVPRVSARPVRSTGGPYGQTRPGTNNVGRLTLADALQSTGDMSKHGRFLLWSSVGVLACAVACAAPDPDLDRDALPDAAPSDDGDSGDDVDSLGATVARFDPPIIIAGSALPLLAGKVPSKIVAFRHRQVSGQTSWQQVPVQIDERAIVDFGLRPEVSPPAGTIGTVYGTAPVGLTALQYTDPNTFVGRDPDPRFDANDELVLMLADTGSKVDPGAAEPAGVVRGSGVEVKLIDPTGGPGNQRWIYLFVSAGALASDAGADYVGYDFKLVSGAYRATYRRGNGPNPETSVVTGGTYQARFVDRWMDADWRIISGASVGPDLLDGLKARFAFTTCGRSNVTFSGIDTLSQAEGAFIANIDGPVRAIRAVIGANSGTYTQRTNTFYRNREDVVTDLRVHPIPGLVEHLDFTTAATGMTYRSSETPDGRVIDGMPDTVSAKLPSWEVVSGTQGTMMFTADIATTAAFPGGVAGVADQILFDDLNSPIEQCWGDNHFLGAAGFQIATDIPNTDPFRGPAKTFQINRAIRFGDAVGPAVDVGADAAAWSAQVRAPVQSTSSRFQP